MKQLTVFITAYEEQQLKWLAEREGRSLSSFCAQILAREVRLSAYIQCTEAHLPEDWRRLPVMPGPPPPSCFLFRDGGQNIWFYSAVNGCLYKEAQ